MLKGVGRQQRTSVHYDTVLHNHIFGVTATPRKTNYEFERRERERNKAADSARKAEAKAEKKGFRETIASGDSNDSTSDR
jgi:hypothetical protein